MRMGRAAAAGRPAARAGGGGGARRRRARPPARRGAAARPAARQGGGRRGAGPGRGAPGRPRPGPGRRWTAAEDAELRRGAGMRNAEIAGRLGRTVPGVDYRRRMLGLGPPRAPARECAVCGREFDARGRALCCGPACSRARHLEYMRARPSRATSATYLLALEALAAAGGRRR